MAWKMKLAIFVGLGIAFGAGAAQADPLEIAYAQDHERQIIDLYFPTVTETQSKDRPVVVYVHGGGWVAGNRKRTGDKEEFFSEQGMVFASIGYRLAPQFKHPAQVEDVARALSWLHQNIAKYQGNPKKIFLIGHSAGAHLVALVATNPKFLAAYQLQPTDLGGVICLDTGSFDFQADNSQYPVLNQMVEAAFGQDPAILQEASPLQQVQSGGKYPPFLLAAIQLRSDSTQQSQALRDKLLATGSEAQYLEFATTHYRINANIGDADDSLTQEILTFIQKHKS